MKRTELVLRVKPKKRRKDKKKEILITNSDYKGLEN